MAQSLAKNYLHMIFSTKHKQSFIDKAIETELHSYLAGICNNLESFPVKIGGYSDHIHILCLLCKKITLIKLIEDIKSDSSNWMKTQGDHYKNFFWQAGYGAFSVSPYEVETVKRYIENQHEHHKHENFQDEYRHILKKHQIEFDERYLWD
jgi:REP element-mobilizing transposase RayT